MVNQRLTRYSLGWNLENRGAQTLPTPREGAHWSGNLVPEFLAWDNLLRYQLSWDGSLMGSIPGRCRYQAFRLATSLEAELRGVDASRFRREGVHSRGVPDL